MCKICSGGKRLFVVYLSDVVFVLWSLEEERGSYCEAIHVQHLGIYIYIYMRRRVFAYIIR